MSTTKKTIIVIVGIVLWACAVWALILFFQSLASKTPQAQTKLELRSPRLLINNKEIILEVSDTQATRDLGLSNRESLPEDHAMLFVFDEPGMYGFWMKDMHFSIDMVFLDENFRVITIASNVAPETFPEAFLPKVPAKYVLEFNAGFAEKHNIVEGTQISIK
jgi:uncharacterized membrane protein (UPF0127 family)